ncbi:radical SAM protein [Sulfolobus sp. A20]|uniref:7-carboxy-7-deazaguanine synthase QueE n=1 Tax=Sulfolobaceae TaxID=118883 RepID=UPI000846191A|nr:MULTISPECIES: 7-carboxy-7-deazaguanine synthase QueE [unclassified Sulfolobus]TRM76493.1 7-carboxy-7-deazaguanine synthase QueE [Sulfolobus sp. E5]TRM79942.1 7-carboxy-7-deazaguanine synthase QueE [Sulfolobus sp. A20-N-F6]TRM85318.1 7-carboxy-7-deazaguanine synthase QueE [Sulfolobus sp. F3]TRM87422.1 7-carboxy-7-deazaguanine synthase QueE [Sulfolobus sp. E3]TRN00231.1 7-carboxy-7-deazaguanine synthase QueE [Sulfolobus sp. E1]
MKYRVIEIFTSIQGEGEVIGRPSNFIRLATCNLRCVWCDTKYSWSVGTLMDIDEIVARLDNRIKLTTITGGEPLLQNLEPLAEVLKGRLGHKIVIETNGTIKPSEKLRKLVDVFSVSPKLSNSGHNINYNFKDDDWATYYKFVIVYPHKDIDEVVKFVESQAINPEKVILQPDGNRQDYIDAISEITEVLLSKGLQFRILPQFHRILGIR